MRGVGVVDVDRGIGARGTGVDVTDRGIGAACIGRGPDAARDVGECTLDPAVPCPRLWSPEDMLEIEDVRMGRARREIGGEGLFRGWSWSCWKGGCGIGPLGGCV